MNIYFYVNHIAICMCNGLKCWFKHPLPESCIDGGYICRRVLAMLAMFRSVFIGNLQSKRQDVETIFVQTHKSWEFLLRA